MNLILKLLNKLSKSCIKPYNLFLLRRIHAYNNFKLISQKYLKCIFFCISFCGTFMDLVVFPTGTGLSKGRYMTFCGVIKISSFWRGHLKVLANFPDFSIKSTSSSPSSLSCSTTLPIYHLELYKPAIQSPSCTGMTSFFVVLFEADLVILFYLQ